MTYLDLTNEVFAPLSDDVWEVMRGADRALSRGEAGNEPPVRELESRVAEMSGTEAALFLPSTTVATRLYLSSLGRRGERAFVERRSHLMWMQHQVLSRTGGMIATPVDGGARGVMSPDALRAAHGERVLGTPIPTGLVGLENTHNVCGGTVLTPHETAVLADASRSFGAECFLDGARVFDAAVAQRVSIAELIAPVDVAVIALTKSVGAPYGAIVTGTERRISDIRSIATAEGALQVHRRGPFAAAALMLLERVDARVVLAHQNARLFAELLGSAPQISVRTPETNIVRVDLPPGTPADAVSRRLEQDGVGSRIIEHSSLRFIPHAGLTVEEVTLAADRVAATVLNYLEAETDTEARGE